jgi:hypothetical protein
VKRGIPLGHPESAVGRTKDLYASMGARRNHGEILRSPAGELRMTRLYEPFDLNMQSSVEGVAG